MIKRRRHERAPDGTGQGPLVVGERGEPLVARTLSRQARLSNALAMGVMLLLGIAVLGWYYERQFATLSRLRQSRQLAASAAAGTEMALPPLGELLPARADPPSPPRSDPPLPATLTTIARVPALPMAPLAVAASYAAGAGPPGSERAAAHSDRRLQGEVYAGAMAGSQDTGAAGPAPAGPAPAPSTPAALTVSAALSQPGQLAPPDGVPVRARRLRDRSLLLSKGTFIDCTLETAIDSTLPGITSCVTATDTYSADGRVVLLERGTRLFGETQGQVQQGSARVYVLWTEARTPTGVVVPLESPGTDELGRAGLPGKVQRHFWERFGAAILLSTIDGAVQAAVQASSRNDGTIIYDPGATQDVMTEVLKGTVAIAPTIIKRNGDRIEVLVARDVDFAPVYELRATGAGD